LLGEEIQNFSRDNQALLDVGAKIGLDARQSFVTERFSVLQRCTIRN
jgi:hypothetical protein